MPRVVDWKASPFSAPAVQKFADSIFPDNWGGAGSVLKERPLLCRNLVKHINPKVVLGIKGKGRLRVQEDFLICFNLCLLNERIAWLG